MTGVTSAREKPSPATAHLMVSEEAFQFRFPNEDRAADPNTGDSALANQVVDAGGGQAQSSCCIWCPRREGGRVSPAASVRGLGVISGHLGDPPFRLRSLRFLDRRIPGKG